MSSERQVNVRRIYEPARAADGWRVLVDRVWPRGLRKDHAQIDEWCKQVAPSTELRRWYGHDPERFAEFARHYRAELGEPERAEALERLRAVAGEQPVTLLTATKDPDLSQAAILADALRAH
ncbi:DUF488 family protein [Actinobacteria bacterium YIM 96077]|uniref:DUF488 domain-containing protein n=1 Tax=Phytoactinopolyspora halophila TaxID=1981511 RepID=A0A329QZA9_9ACTN|nr:DUF488 family protein [Phytoactinopolyspora halophila]AYY13204.1 DUF488 family protein [Actinobacteria bacterium YIM 96077]RAW17557.1 DUF488 domain-containing protein [Phytoactinopolyspora halophila]